MCKNIYEALQAYINQQSEVNRVHCRNLKIFFKNSQTVVNIWLYKVICFLTCILHTNYNKRIRHITLKKYKEFIFN